MYSWKSAFVLLACLQAVRAFTCPDDGSTFYHADVSAGCRVYHLCQNSQLSTMTCPSGQSFNHETLKCEDAALVHCYETMVGHDHHHNHNKRAIDDRDAQEKNAETDATKVFTRIDLMTILLDSAYDSLDTFTIEVIVPTAVEMLSDGETSSNLFSIFDAFMDTYGQILDKYTSNEPGHEDTGMKIPRALLANAKKMFTTRSLPFVNSVLEKHFPEFVHRLYENIPAVLEEFRKLEEAEIPNVKVLKEAVLKFLNKHEKVLKSSPYSDIVANAEVQNDFRPLKITFLQVIQDSVSDAKEELLTTLKLNLSLIHSLIDFM